MSWTTYHWIIIEGDDAAALVNYQGERCVCVSLCIEQRVGVGEKYYYFWKRDRKRVRAIEIHPFSSNYTQYNTVIVLEITTIHGLQGRSADDFRSINAWQTIPNIAALESLALSIPLSPSREREGKIEGLLFLFSWISHPLLAIHLQITVRQRRVRQRIVRVRDREKKEKRTKT